MALTILAYLAGLLMGHWLGHRVSERLDRLSPGQLADIYRREHQHQLDGRLPMWE